MSENEKGTGLIAWCDLTVPNAEAVRDFYHHVVGWQIAEVDMGGYSDYCMNEPATGQTVCGVCHARGVNADLPAAWMIYITVDDVERAARAVEERGGSIVRPPTQMGPQGRYCVIRDPAGAVAALYQKA